MIGVDASQLTWRCSFPFHLQLFKTWNFSPPGSLFWLSTLKQCNCWLLTSNRAGSQQPGLHRTQKKCLTSNFQTKHPGHPTQVGAPACFGHRLGYGSWKNRVKFCFCRPNNLELPTAWDAGVCSNEFQYAWPRCKRIQQGRQCWWFARGNQPRFLPKGTQQWPTPVVSVPSKWPPGPASVDFFGIQEDQQQETSEM